MREDAPVLYLIHGSGMITIWAVCTLIGVVIARYFRHKKWWLYGHFIMQSFAFLCTLPMAILAFYTGFAGGQKNITTNFHKPGGDIIINWHLAAGPIITILTILQGLSGKLRLHDLHIPSSRWTCFIIKRTSRQARLLGRFHSVIGKLLLTLAMGQLYTGCHMLFDDKEVESGFFSFWSLLICALVGLEILVLRRNPRKFYKEAITYARELDTKIWDSIHSIQCPCLTHPAQTVLGLGLRISNDLNKTTTSTKDIRGISLRSIEEIEDNATTNAIYSSERKSSGDDGEIYQDGDEIHCERQSSTISDTNDV